MLENHDASALTLSSLDGGGTSAPGGPEQASPPAIALNGLPQIEVRVVAGIRVVDIVNTDVLFEEGAIRHLKTQLHGLVEEGCTRLLLNFGGIRYISSAVLA